MIKQWQYFVNPFLAIGLRSFRKAVKISTYTDHALAGSADPFYTAQYSIYHPLHVALIAAYNAWKAQGGTQKGSTLLVAEYLNQLQFTKINAWDAAVQVVYPKGSSQYVAIFPKGHRPFQRGSIESRINTVNSLSISLTGIIALAAVKTDVDSFDSSINDARSSQDSQKSTTQVDSYAVTTAVTNAMKGLYIFLCNGMANFSDDTTVLEAMIDLQTLRHHTQTDFTGKVKPLMVRTVCKRTFHEDIFVEIENTGNVPLVVYSSANKRAMPGSTAVTVAPNDTMIVNIESLGPLENHYIRVYNSDAFQTAEFNINLDTEAMSAAA